MGAFDILMVISLGTLAGTLIGLTIGFLARRQKPVWGEMDRREKTINIALVILFSVACSAGLAWYAFA